MIKKISYYYFIALLIFIPFQSLTGELLYKNADLSDGNIFWLLHWYEVIIPIILIFAVINLLKNKKIILLQIFAILLLVLGALSVLFISPSIKVGIEGFRFTLFSILILFTALAFSYGEQKKNKIINIYLILSVIIAVFAIIERFLPETFWLKYNLIPETSGFAGAFRAGTIRQSSSLIGAPNQLASYLLPAFFIFLTKIKLRKSLATFYLLFSTIIGIAIVLTFSRSALVALAAGLLVWTTFFLKNKITAVVIWLATILGITFIFWAYKYGGEELKNFISHGTSQGFHYEAMKGFWEEFRSRLVLDKIFGSGLGTSGPAVLKFGDGLIPESWYLQLSLELGIAGLVLWISSIISALKSLLINKEEGLSLGLLSISIVALFLHTWADNPAVAYTIFLLIGISLCEKNTGTISKS